MFLSQEAIDDFKKDGYSFEEISRISDSLGFIKKGETISFENIIKNSIKNKKSIHV